MEPEVNKPIEEPQTHDELLKDPAFFDRVDAELAKTIVGEEQSRKAILLFAAISFVKNRGKNSANNLLVNAESSGGKDHVTRQIIGLFPNAETLDRASAKIFTYWKTNDPEFTWDGKICHLLDISDDLLKSDDFKVFASDAGKRVVVNKDKTGKTAAIEYEVKGRPIIIATTANANPSDEVLNRFNIIGLDESQKQTEAITERRLREASGEIDATPSYDSATMNAFHKLRPVEVIIPYARLLSNHLPNDIRARRDVPRILNLIRAGAAFHQFQREKDERDRIIATERDYELARAALQKIQTGSFVALTRSLRQAYDAAGEWVKENKENSFTVRELWAAKPICAERSLYRALEKLAKLRLLSVKYEDRPGVKQKVMVFSVVSAGLNSIHLPPFNELSKVSNDTKVSNVSKESSVNSTFDTIDTIVLPKCYDASVKTPEVTPPAVSDTSVATGRVKVLVLKPWVDPESGREFHLGEELGLERGSVLTSLLKNGYVSEL